MAEPTTDGSGTTAAAAQPPGVRSADDIKRDPLVASAISSHSAAVLDAREFAGEVTLTIDRDQIAEVCRSFKNDGFKYLVDLAGLDYSKYPGHTRERYCVAYLLYSHAKNQRVRLKVFTDGAAVPSVSGVWKTANWHERETFDMFGIDFQGHPNLERILMWDGFNGHPLRKDFPIRGIDTGARIYPEVFPEGGGPKAGSTGKDVKDVNVYKENWDRDRYGTSPVGLIAAATHAPAPELATQVAETAKPTEEAPFHDPDMPLPQRMELAVAGDLKTKLFAAMAQTDCTACGWDCEGYADALSRGETKDVTLCVPGEDETESMVRQLMAAAGKI